MDDTVIFKGTKDGLQILLKEKATFSAIKESLIKKLEYSGKFFYDSKSKVIFLGRTLEDAEKQELRTILHEQYAMTSMEIIDNIPQSPIAEGQFELFEEDKDMENDMIQDIELEESLFVRRTIRNGQRISSNGNVTILGDVNPGAEIIAGGNIAVMGSLRGMAHAGVSGDAHAVVAAFNLQPTQLRIAGIINRPPEDEIIRPTYPELARVKDGVIIIEPYLPSRGR